MEHRYQSGEKVYIGDRVSWAGSPGLVVFVIDHDEYLPAFSSMRPYWSSFGRGIGLQTESAGLVLENDAEDLELVARGSPIA